MRHGSLFSGIGGFDLAAEWMGWENVFHCEWNDFGKRVLKYHFPQSISYDDITETDFSVHRGHIDILTGGFPCQPYSAAGKRLGKEDDRHLWPEMLRAIREIEPRWVVGENVRGLLNWNEGVVLDEIYADLEAEGYEVETFVLPAVGVNAPHRRERVWIVAYSTDTGTESLRQGREDSIYGSQVAPDTNSKERDGRGGTGQRERQETEQGRDGVQRTAARPSEVWNAPDSNSKVSQRRDGGLQGRKNDGSARESGQERNQQSSRRFQSAWQDFPTQPPVCGGDDGIPRQLDSITFPKWRKESIMAYGNAIVPQVASQIFKAIELYESAH